MVRLGGLGVTVVMVGVCWSEFLNEVSRCLLMSSIQPVNRSGRICASAPFLQDDCIGGNR